jgi:hypothetical protein
MRIVLQCRYRPLPLSAVTIVICCRRNHRSLLLQSLFVAIVVYYRCHPLSSLFIIVTIHHPLFVIVCRSFVNVTFVTVSSDIRQRHRSSPFVTVLFDIHQHSVPFIRPLSSINVCPSPFIPVDVSYFSNRMYVFFKSYVRIFQDRI